MRKTAIVHLPYNAVHKARDIRDSSSECSRFIRKAKEQISRKKCISKKSTPSVGNVVNFNSACKNNHKRKRCEKPLGTYSTRKSNLESRLEEFMNLSKERLTFVCVVCNRCF